MTEQFNLKEHVTNGIRLKSVEDATDFAEKHGFKVRVTRIWRSSEWHYLAVTRDFIESRINVAVDENGKIIDFLGMG